MELDVKEMRREYASVILAEISEMNRRIWYYTKRKDTLIKQLQEVCEHPESSMMDSGNCGLCGMKDVDQL